MKFEDALKSMREGKQMLHQGKIYLLKGNTLMTPALGDETFLSNIDIGVSDILSGDWEDADEFKCSFFEAMKAASEGKDVTNPYVVETFGHSSFYRSLSGKLAFFDEGYLRERVSISNKELQSKWKIME